MELLGVFFAAVLVYALSSRPLDRWSITPQIALLLAGLGLGLLVRNTPEVELDLGWLEIVGEAALVLCLFVDAARIDVAALRGTAGLPLRLLGIGLPLTIMLGTALALLIFPGIAPAEALLLAALVAPTDAALGAAVVTSDRLPLRIRQALNVESGLNDGLVTPIVLVAVAAIEAGSEGGTGWIGSAVSEIGLGALAGIVVGVVGGLVLRWVIRRDLMLDGADWMTGPALAVLAWFGADLLGGNAFIAAFVGGLATSATVGRLPRGVLEFGEIAGELLGLAVFFLFGVAIPTLGRMDLGVVMFAVLGLTVVRMVPVAASLVGTRLARPTVLFMGWFGPRGLATIVLGLVAIREAVGGAAAFDPVVFPVVGLTVAGSVLAHGLSAGPAVRAYARIVDGLPSDAPEHEAAVDLPARGPVARRRRRVEVAATDRSVG